MPKLTQDFNIFPYFDDYDETKSFYKILFRPGYSVQARELTQIQSILQNQIEKTGDVLFQDGSKVSGGELTINTSINSLQVKFAYQGAEINIANFAESSDIRSLIGVMPLRVALLLAVEVRPPAYLIKSNNESSSFNS